MELRSLIKELENNEKKYLELYKKSRIGEFCNIKTSSFSVAIFLVIYSVLINSFVMPLHEIGQLLFNFITFNFDLIKQNNNILQSFCSFFFLYICGQAIFCNYKYAICEKVDLKAFDTNYKIESLDFYFNYESKKKEVDTELQEIISKFKAFHKKNDIHEAKKYLFKQELDKFDKFLNTKTGKEITE